MCFDLMILCLSMLEPDDAMLVTACAPNLCIQVCHLCSCQKVASSVCAIHLDRTTMRAACKLFVRSKALLVSTQCADHSALIWVKTKASFKLSV